MKSFYPIVALIVLSFASTAQSPDKHSFGLAVNWHQFESAATKSEVQAKYFFAPHESFNLATNLGYGTYGNLQHNDGFLHLHQMVSASIELNVKPLYSFYGQRKSYRFDPFISVGVGSSRIENKQQVNVDRELNFMNLGIGTFFHLKKYSSILIGYQQQSSTQKISELDNSKFVQLGLVYRFHHKLQDINEKEYDRLAEEFMHTVVNKEKVEEEKQIVETDKELMEQSYDQMLESTESKLAVTSAALNEARNNNELLLESNFELSLEIKALRQELKELKLLKLGSKDLNDYRLVEQLGNPYSNATESEYSHIALQASYNLHELKAQAKKHLSDYEDILLMQNEDKLFVLVVKVDLNPDELNYEINNLSQIFPTLFQLMGNH